MHPFKHPLRQAAGPLLAAALALSPAPLLAHDFIVKPGTVQAGIGLPVSLLMTEVYIQPDRMPALANTTLELLSPTGRTTVPLTANPAGKSLDARVDMSAAQPAILLGRMARDRSMTADGVKPLPKGAPGAIETTRSVSFSKALVNPVQRDQHHAVAVGARLEILPLANPADLRPDDALPVKVLFDGKPLATKLQASRDGHSATKHGFTTRTESGADGVARIPLMASGLWLIRAKHAVAESTGDYDRYEAAANLVFRID